MVATIFLSTAAHRSESGKAGIVPFPFFLQVTAVVCIRKENHHSSANGKCLPISKNQVFLGVIPGHTDLIFLE